MTSHRTRELGATLRHAAMTGETMSVLIDHKRYKVTAVLDMPGSTWLRRDVELAIWEVEDTDDCGVMADAAIEAIATALLSPEAVEAAARALLTETQVPLKFRKSLEECPSGVREQYVGDASAALTSALAAIGYRAEGDSDE